MSDLVKVSDKGHVRTIMLNRAEKKIRNLRAALEQADPDAR